MNNIDIENLYFNYDESELDEGQKEAEELIYLMLYDVAELYAIVLKNILKIIKDYFKKFATKDKIKRKMLKSGEITQKEYSAWKSQLLMMGQRWKDQASVICGDLTKAHGIAKSIVQGYIPDVYSIGSTYGQYQIEKELSQYDIGISGSVDANVSYTLYDRDTVEKLMRENPQILPELNPYSETARLIREGKINQWTYQQLQSQMLQGILAGESNDQIADRLQNITNQELKSVTRYARTATTAAENAGRIDSYQRAEKMGIELEQQWLATLDMRTRSSHRQLDGESIKVGEKFSNGLRFPGDPQGAAGEVWNCRCTLVAKLTGIPELEADNDLSQLSNREAEKLNGMSYQDWKKAKAISHPILKARQIGERRKKAYIDEYIEAAERLKNVIV